MTRILCALVVVTSLALAGCSGDDGSDGSDGADGSDGSTVVSGTTIEGATDKKVTEKVDPGKGLTFTRTVSTTYELDKSVAECVETDAGTTVVRLTSPENYEKLFSQGKVGKPVLAVEVVPGTKGRADLPLTSGDEETTPPVTVSGVDSADQNQLTGAGARATGSITIVEAACDPEPRLSFTIRATLDSESPNLPTMHVVGGLSATGMAS